MDHATKERHTATGKGMEEEAIKMTDEWARELQSMPYTSQKKGKFLNLLKASAKPIKKDKKRKIIPLLGSIKDYHNAPIQSQNPVQQSKTQEIFNFKSTSNDNTGGNEVDEKNSNMGN